MLAVVESGKLETERRAGSIDGVSTGHYLMGHLMGAFDGASMEHSRGIPSSSDWHLPMDESG
jgi:hypothetical protein